MADEEKCPYCGAAIDEAEPDYRAWTCGTEYWVGEDMHEQSMYCLRVCCERVEAEIAALKAERTVITDVIRDVAEGLSAALGVDCKRLSPGAASCDPHERANALQEAAYRAYSPLAALLMPRGEEIGSDEQDQEILDRAHAKANVARRVEQRGGQDE